MANAEEGTMMSSRALMIGLSMALITVSVLAAYLVLSSDNAAEPQISPRRDRTLQGASG